ncbi:MAG: hypothetical protein AAB448_03440, partial [Patescibacteria group bacterium]
TVVQATPFTELMDPVCEAYLYAASRAHTLRNVIKPVLNRGGIVVVDRSIFSSVSWQGFGRGLGKETILSINAHAVENIWPTTVVYLHGNLKEMMTRTFDAAGDKFEKFPQEFFMACEEGYEDISRDKRFASIWKSILANGTKEEVFQKILFALQQTD